MGTSNFPTNSQHRFIYIDDKVYISPECYPGFYESLPSSFFKELVFITKEYHELLCYCIHHNFFHNAYVHCAALLQAVAYQIAKKYDGELRLVTKSVFDYTALFYLNRGFHPHGEVTNLEKEMEILIDAPFFYLIDIHRQQATPRFRMSSSRGNAITETSYCEALFDIIMSPDLSESTDLSKDFPNGTIDQLAEEDLAYVRDEIAPLTRDILKDYVDQISCLLSDYLDGERNSNITDPEFSGNNYYELLILAYGYERPLPIWDRKFYPSEKPPNFP